jgi:hypothetical protein
MQTKENGREPKSNESRGKLKEKLGNYFSVDRTTPRPSDRIIETYRGVLRGIRSVVAFEDTVDVMIALGCFSSTRTKTDLRLLFDERMAELQKGGANV